jgi:transglutaminase/protease-like cytokinesis protein 3
MNKIYLLIVLLFSITISAQIEVDSVRYKHALKAPKTLDVTYLARYLKAGAKSNEKTVETFYYWIHQNIEYDNELSKKQVITEEDTSVKKTLEKRKTICDGYSLLFLELCQAVKIDCVKIAGIALIGDDKEGQPHAWNAVNLNNKWLLIDSTWGSGGSFSPDTYEKHLNLKYLFGAPDYFIITHLPDDSKWQLLEKTITKNDFLSKTWIEKRIREFYDSSVHIQSE